MRPVALVVWAALAAAVCGPTWGADPVIVGKTAFPEHALARLQVENIPPNTAFLWKVSPNVDRATTAKHRLEFAAPPGTYTVSVLLFSVNDGEPALAEILATVTIGGKGPGPGPTPPDPTPPVPPPPGPTSSLDRDLAAGYAKDQEPDKATLKAALAKAYAEAAAANWTQLSTAGDAFGLIRSLRVKHLPKVETLDHLKNTRAAVGPYLAAALPNNPDAALTDDHRKTAIDLCRRVAAALEALR